MPDDFISQQRRRLFVEQHWYYRRRRQRKWRVLALIVLTAALLAVLFGLIIGVDVVTGNSMYPSLQAGDLIFYLRLGRSPQRGDMVVFRQEAGPQPGDIVKRVAGLPGDTVEIDAQTGRVIVNGQVLREPYVLMGAEESGEVPPLTVLGGHLFVLGDNRQVSIDSRDSQFGTVPQGKLLGRVVLVLRCP